MANAPQELAPTGRLRAGMNLGNVLFTGKDPASGEIAGVSVDLMRELASHLGVPVDFVMYPTPGEVADAVDKGAWDVAILAIEAARAEKIAFSPPLTEIEATYAVHRDSALRSCARRATSSTSRARSRTRRSRACRATRRRSRPSTGARPMRCRD
jgi:polar amino acid transport system substrate-binding protein